MQEDETGNLRGVLVKDVITAWNRYMDFLYCIGGIRCSTKVYFSLSTLAGDSRYHIHYDFHKCELNGRCMYPKKCVLSRQSFKKEV